jgi:hypothetical protein
MQIACRDGRPVVRVERWDGPPPASCGQVAQVSNPLRLRLPSGRLGLLHLPPGEAGIKEIRNAADSLVGFPPGDYHVCLSKRWRDGHDHPERYLVQFWPAQADRV